ncbi:uncharacterized protein LOC144446930 [Glandiceps talaboti]
MEDRYRVEFDGNLAILHMDNGENRYNNGTLKALHKALDTVERNSAVEAFITVGVGKFYSNGLDLNWLMQQDKETMEKFHRFRRTLYSRILTFPVPTIAAINGHCYAAGGIFALCHDYRVMRTKRGWFCLPEVHINRPFKYPMAAILRHKIPAGRLMRDMAILGQQYNSERLFKEGMIDGVADEDKLLDLAKEVAIKSLGKNGFSRSTLQQMKESMYEEVVEAFEYSTLEDPDCLVYRKKTKAKL